MLILEGRGKGATWALLKETVRNQGIYISMHQSRTVQDMFLDDMLAAGEISEHGYDYLCNSCFSFREFERGQRRENTPIYIDNLTHYINHKMIQDFGNTATVGALSNDTAALLENPKMIGEMSNSYIVEQKREEL